MTTDAATLAIYAEHINLTPREAVAFRSAVEICSRKVGMQEQTFLRQLTTNQELGQYVKGLCATAANSRND